MSRQCWAILASAAITASIGFSAPSHGQMYADECNFEGGKIEYNMCVHKKLEAQVSKMIGNKACSASNCLYKLAYLTQGSGGGYQERRYAGAGFEFVILLKPTGDNLEATLYDAEGGTTIVETCETHWCYGRYRYKSGPMRGAKLSQFNYTSDEEIKNSFWILELPR